MKCNNKEKGGKRELPKKVFGFPSAMPTLSRQQYLSDILLTILYARDNEIIFIEF